MEKICENEQKTYTTKICYYYYTVVILKEINNVQYHIIHELKAMFYHSLSCINKRQIQQTAKEINFKTF